MKSIVSVIVSFFLLAAVALAGAPGSNHGVTLTWAESGCPTCTFNVYRGTAPGAENYSAPIASGVSTAAYLDQSGTAGTTYYYTVTAVLNKIESTPSNEVSVPFPTVPPSPSSLTATPQ